MDFGLSTQQLNVISALSSGASTTAAADQAGVHRNTIAYWRRNHLPFQQALSHAQYDRAMLFREKAEELADLALQTIEDILRDPQAPASVRLRAALAIIQTASTPPEPKKQVTLEIEKIKLVNNPEPQTLEATGPIPSLRDLMHPDPAASPAQHKNAQSCPNASAVSRPGAALHAQTLNENAQPDSCPGDSPVGSGENPSGVHKFAQSRPPVQSRSTSAPACASAENPSAMHEFAQTVRRTGPKIGRNDSCPCGSGKKYKKCCIGKPHAVAA